MLSSPIVNPLVPARTQDADMLEASSWCFAVMMPANGVSQRSWQSGLPEQTGNYRLRPNYLPVCALSRSHLDHSLGSQ